MPDFSGFFENYEGNWQLDRIISDGSRLAGFAKVSRISENLLLFEETGNLEMQGGEVVSANRSWRWETQKNAFLNVYYDETPLRLYHALELAWFDGAWEASAEHRCGEDVYAGEYRFEKNLIEIDQTVKGPNKDYSLGSVYQRQ